MAQIVVVADARSTGSAPTAGLRSAPCALTLFINSVTYRSCINRIACNSHSDNKKPISGTHVDNKMCDRRPLHSVISGSIGVRAGERFFIGLTQLTRCQPIFKSFLSRVSYNRFHINLGSKVVSVVSVGLLTRKTLANLNETRCQRCQIV